MGGFAPHTPRLPKARDASGGRYELDDPAWVVEGDVQVAVGAVHHRAHAAELAEQDLLLDHLVAVDRDAAELLPDEAAQEEVVLPIREAVAGVERDPAHGERR